MKFKLYHPDFVTLSESEEREYERWRKVESLREMLEILDPYRDEGSEFFVETRDGFHREDEPYYLMEYTSDGKWWVKGFVKGDPPCETATWDKEGQEWKIKPGIPEKRFE